MARSPEWRRGKEWEWGSQVHGEAWSGEEICEARDDKQLAAEESGAVA